jgi:hypothetical protein
MTVTWKNGFFVNQTGECLFIPTFSNEEALKEKYRRELSNRSENGVDFIFPKGLPSDQSEALYLILKNVFTDRCLNNHRNRIVESLLNVPPDQWSVLMNQVYVITHIDTKGHDVMCVTEILTSIASVSFRAELVTALIGLTKNQSSSTLQRFVLSGLSKLSRYEIQQVSLADKWERKDLIHACLPSDC